MLVETIDRKLHVLGCHLRPIMELDALLEGEGDRFGLVRHLPPLAQGLVTGGFVVLIQFDERVVDVRDDVA